MPADTWVPFASARSWRRFSGQDTRRWRERTHDRSPVIKPVSEAKSAMGRSRPFTAGVPIILPATRSPKVVSDAFERCTRAQQQTSQCTVVNCSRFSSILIPGPLVLELRHPLAFAKGWPAAVGAFFVATHQLGLVSVLGLFCPVEDVLEVEPQGST